MSTSQRHHFLRILVCLFGFLLAPISTQAQLDFYTEAETSLIDVGAGAAYSDMMSEGWIDAVIPLHSRDKFAVGFHGRYAGSEFDRSDYSIGLITGFWFERANLITNLYGYWDRHEFASGDFDEAVFGAEFRHPRWGELRAAAHLPEDGVFVTGVRQVSSGSSETEVFSQTRIEVEGRTTRIFEDRRTTVTETTIDTVFRDFLENGDAFEVEYGRRLPWFDRYGNLGLFVGYSWWDRSVEPIEGISARLQFAFNDYLAVQVRYFEDDLILGGQDHWRFEIAGRIPLGRRELPTRGTFLGSGPKAAAIDEPRPALLNRPSRITWPVFGRGQRIDSDTTVSSATTNETILLQLIIEPEPEPVVAAESGGGGGGGNTPPPDMEEEVDE
tara:strand:+ start:6285 stop:7439 length:1155 start_codon:yes stop_codon:yes gene_type:complete